MTGRVGLAAMLAASAVLAQQVLVEGRADSPVRVLIYEDLRCSDCADFRVMMDTKILPKYSDRVAFLHRDFPLAKHPLARPAAIAARFFGARDAKLGLEYRRRALAAIAEITDANFKGHLAAFASEHSIAPAEAVAALGDKRLDSLVEKDFQEGVARGVARTPTVFVNGKPFIETFTFAEISKGIDEALAETK